MAALDLKKVTVAFVPGTGRMGKLLAGHLAKAGISVFVGSREAEKGRKTAEDVSKVAQSASVKGGTNQEAAAAGDVIFWTPAGPLDEREELLKSLAKDLEGKIIVDVTNVMYFFEESQWGQVSAPLLNQKALGVPARWTTAFKSIFWKLLEDLPSVQNPFHVFVVGDDEEAVATTIALVDAIPGFKGTNSGPLKNSKIVELLGPRFLAEMDKSSHGDYRSGWRYGL